MAAKTSHLLPMAWMAIALAGSCARAAEPFDPSVLLRDLASPAKHAAALEMLKQIPESALLPVVEAADNSATPEPVRKELASELPSIYARLKLAWIDRWSKETLSNFSKAASEYEKFGTRDPKWDALVAAGFAAIQEDDPAGIKRMQAAIDAGCTDPLVTYFYAKLALQADQIDLHEGIHLLERASRQMGSTQYPPIRKFFADLRFVGFSNLPDRPADISRQRREDAYREAIILLGDAARQTMTHIDADEAALALYEAGLEFFGNNQRQKVFDMVYPAVAEALPDNPGTYVVASRFYIDWAWEARGTGYAGEVTPEGWRLFKERIQLAGDAAAKGWRLNPLDARCAVSMIKVSMVDGTDRNEMEKWYRRAILADPDNREARTAKWNYLLPQWHGSMAELLAFGRQSVKEGDFENRIPCTLLDIHLRLAGLAPDPDAYWLQPEVWADLKLIYAKMLPPSRMEKDPIGTRYDRAWYLRHACQCHQWRDFQQLQTQFGGDFDLAEFGGQARFDYFKRKAAETLAPK